jgi:hypothetical protein
MTDSQKIADAGKRLGIAPNDLPGFVKAIEVAIQGLLKANQN